MRKRRVKDNKNDGEGDCEDDKKTAKMTAKDVKDGKCVVQMQSLTRHEWTVSQRDGGRPSVGYVAQTFLLWAYYKRTSTNNNTKHSQRHFIHTSFTLFHCYIEAEVNACGR